MIYATLHMTITNPDALAKYRESAQAALEKHGGSLLCASPKLTRLEGDDPLPSIAGVLSFPDRDAALGWINDPTLADVHALRQASGKTDIVLVG